VEECRDVHDSINGMSMYVNYRFRGNGLKFRIAKFESNMKDAAVTIQMSVLLF